MQRHSNHPVPDTNRHYGKTSNLTSSNHAESLMPPGVPRRSAAPTVISPSAIEASESLPSNACKGAGGKAEQIQYQPTSVPQISGLRMTSRQTPIYAMARQHADRDKVCQWYSRTNTSPMVAMPGEPKSILAIASPI